MRLQFSLIILLLLARLQWSLITLLFFMRDYYLWGLTSAANRVVDRGQFFNRSVGRSVRPPQTDRSVGPFGPTYVDLRTMCGLHGTWYRRIPNMYINTCTSTQYLHALCLCCRATVLLLTSCCLPLACSRHWWNFILFPPSRTIVTFINTTHQNFSGCFVITSCSHSHSMHNLLLLLLSCCGMLGWEHWAARVIVGEFVVLLGEIISQFWNTLLIVVVFFLFNFTSNFQHANAPHYN